MVKINNVLLGFCSVIVIFFLFSCSNQQFKPESKNMAEPHDSSMVVYNFDELCDGCYIRLFVEQPVNNPWMLYEISPNGVILKKKEFDVRAYYGEFTEGNLLMILSSHFDQSLIYNIETDSIISIPFDRSNAPIRIINGQQDFVFRDSLPSDFDYDYSPPHDKTVVVVYDKKTGNRLGSITLQTNERSYIGKQLSFETPESFDFIWRTEEVKNEQYYGVLYYQMWQKGQMVEFYAIDRFPIDHKDFPTESVENYSILNLNDDRIAYTKYPYNWGNGDWVLNYIEYDLRERKTVFRDTLNYNPRLNLSPKVVRVNQNYLLVSDNRLYMVDSLRNRRTLFSCDKCEIVDFMVGYKE